MLGVSVVKDFFPEGVSMDSAMSQVTSYAMSDLFYLPPGTIPPMVMPFDPTAMTPLCLPSVSSATLGEKDLYDIAYFELRNRIQSISGVIASAVYGGVLRRILAYVIATATSTSLAWSTSSSTWAKVPTWARSDAPSTA